MTIARLPRRLLGVWAHPDDETYLSAALMRRVVAAGGHVTVVTATSGEQGGGPADTGVGLGARRERELVAAMAELGVHDVRLLGHPDGACAAADPGRAASEVGAIVRDVRPDLVVTFGPDGITGHPDHAAVGRWTTAAVGHVARAPRLLYATMTDDFVARHDRDYPDLPLTVVGAPVAVGTGSVALRVEPTADERHRKRAALTAHASQVGALIARVGADRLHRWWQVETFREPTAAELTSSVRSSPSDLVRAIDVDRSPRPLQTLSKPRPGRACTVVATTGHTADRDLRTSPEHRNEP